MVGGVRLEFFGPPQPAENRASEMASEALGAFIQRIFNETSTDAETRSAEGMVRAYLDTNVHIEMAKGAVPDADVEAFSLAVQSGQLVAPVSLANLDELVGQFETARPAMLARLASVRQRVGFHGVLKQPGDILRDAIEAYAGGLEAPSVLLPEVERQVVVKCLADVLAGSRRYDDELRQIAQDVKDLKDTWLANMQAARRQSLADLEAVARSWKERQALSFTAYFATAAPDMAASFAEPLGCAAARRTRGLEGLLACLPVRLCVG